MRHARPGSNATAVAGSALLWAWGFLCYLSPVLFVDVSGMRSVGIEGGFFISQAVVVVSAGVLCRVPAARRIAARRTTLGVCAAAATASTLVLASAVASSQLWLILCCGAVHGVCVPLLGAAWGARYSIGSKGMQSLVILSFLVAYALYFALPFVPRVVALACVVAMPAASWALWRADARGRDALWDADASDPLVRGAARTALVELAAGSWEPSGMPWKTLVAMLLAAFVGNMVASGLMGFSYDHAEGLFRGGAFACACIATVALVPSTSDGSERSAATVYRIALAFSAAGLLGLLASGGAAAPLCGALVQGCAFFFQVLVMAAVSRATWERGLSPLLSFCLAQAATAAVVLAGNVAGKQVGLAEAACPGVFAWTCAGAMMVLFLVLAKQAADADGAVRAAASDALDASEASGASRIFGAVHAPDASGAARAFDAPAAGGCERVRNFQGSKEHFNTRTENDIKREKYPLNINSVWDAKDTNGADSAPEGDGEDRIVQDAAAAFDARVGAFAASFRLTKREVEVFSYLAKGRSLPYIADELFVTTGTVKTHTAHIYRKLGVNSKQELLDLFEHGDDV